ncbi:uncharacterized protein LOC130218910 [Danio aesculapii]|uniref:uncharacterized protein LOC130218910 n=1 Tax=Danio aesculapii TaxID=1142201 RepID=UPI0024BF5455|nr:uncharacterized protein LOC130218910 [Danio aesculapii]
MSSIRVSAEDLSCPVCCELFRDAVILSCSHSVCKECLQEFWRSTDSQKCPVCRRSSSNTPTGNLALKNLCESFLEQRNESCSSGSEQICSLHQEILKLLCLEDKQPLCLMCRDSQKHPSHTFRPLTEDDPSFKYKTDLIQKSILIEDGNPARYRLQTTTADRSDQAESYRKMDFGQMDKNKPHTTILLVGETGTGKTKLINTMINYILCVQREDKVWFEITDDQSNETSAHSQTSSITVYGVYLQESPMDLTIIDTPGYGDTRAELDEQIAESFFSLSKSEDGIHAIDAVCLVINANQNRLSDRQIYIFDAIQSLFGRDITENIVLLFTHSNGAPPRNALKAVKEAQIKCAVNEQKNQPVFFLFDNCQSDAHDEEYEMIQEQSWNQSFRGMTGLFKFLKTLKPKSLKMTRDVLQQRNQLEAKISNLKSLVQVMKLKQNELKQTQEALGKNKCYVQSNKNFEYEVEVSYKEKVDIDRSVDEAAMCCTVCEENCHYPGCWWTSDVSQCSVMRKNHCTVCTNKCHYSKHIKAPKIYVTKTKKEKRTNEDLKKKCDEKIKTNESAIKKLEEELQELEKEKIKSVFEAFHCVDILQFIALNTDSLNTLQHVDFLIEKLKEIEEPERVKTLEDIKRRAEGKYRALRFIKRC